MESARPARNRLAAVEISGMVPAMIRASFAALLLAHAAIAVEPPVPADVRRRMIASFEETRRDADAELAKNPDSAEWLTRRGDARLFLGDAKGAVADFEREIAIEPSHDVQHWRLGIAYLFAGEFAKSAKQFEKYHAFDGRDRENGVWQFLANARVVGIEKARTSMLEYTRFDREPFPALYEMFAGRKTGAEVLAEMEKKGLGDDALVMFFAHYYVGLNEDLLGEKDAAREHLAKAVGLALKAGARGGPGYMGQVARLHYEAMPAK
jgi:lipoprotein NlpI